MFEVPEAKRVRRSKVFDHFDSASSESEDETGNSGTESKSKPITKLPPQTQVRTKKGDAADDDSPVNYGFEYEFIDKTETGRPSSSSIQPPPSKHINDQKDNSDEEKIEDQEESKEQTFEFPLFFKPATATTQQSTLQHDHHTTKPSTTAEANNTATQSVSNINKITIRSPTPESARGPADGSIIKPRPHADYFTFLAPQATQQALQLEYASSAISGAEIESLSHLSWIGTKLPWRVIHIASKSNSEVHKLKNHANHSTGTSTSTRMSRSRPSKKRRILIRQRLALRTSQREEAQKLIESRDLAEREKRTRRNREKKVKRKAREKQKKADAAIVTTGGDADADKTQQSDGSGDDSDGV